jgi:hypothetical protein
MMTSEESARKWREVAAWLRVLESKGALRFEEALRQVEVSQWVETVVQMLALSRGITIEAARERVKRVAERARIRRLPPAEQE